MPQFLLELFSEEIPARMQAGAARDLDRLARQGLAALDLPFDTVRAFAGPRRLTLVVDGLPKSQADRLVERKGPRIGAPETAVQGFVRSTGLTADKLIERDGALWAIETRAGRPTAEVLGEWAASLIGSFPWPKSMTWGSGALRWVRPLHRILCVFDRQIAPVRVGGLEAADLSEGHRVMGPGHPFRARDFDEYREALAGHFVVLDREERKRRIVEGARDLCAREALDLVEDAGLLEEVAGMAEWPTPLLGHMDERFLSLPAEVIRTAMRTHQRYFAVRRPEGASLSPRFIVVANLETADGGALIAAGAARVLTARLTDARFFWDEDRKVSLEGRFDSLRGITFHARLGSLHDRAMRLEALAGRIAERLGFDPALARLTGRLAKADLATAMVGEFPELQGVMGAYYARAEDLPDEVAQAIGDHYRPQGPADSVPTDPTGIAVALADKIDTLAGFFSIDERPTGSRDPYALRRAALGVIRIVLENGLRLPLDGALWAEALGRPDPAVEQALTDFLAERLRVMLRDGGARHDLVDASLAMRDPDLVRARARLNALTDFLSSSDGLDLLAGYRRAANILESEAKKGPLPIERAGPVASPREEGDLQAALARVKPALAAALATEDFRGAMSVLASLRAPVDAFFEAVLVNSPDRDERINRLALLVEVRETMATVADFGRIVG
ncbi:MAG: glycine--tRNA ligase subunit beta [Caulobacteraceae bacterium]|nr:glycine--tRNA ligase subunit beta [Caulobacteraceae bacterium]